MTQTAHFIAADLGASSGRIMLGRWDGRIFTVEEQHRFANGGIHVGDGLYWNALGLWSEIQTGLTKCHSRYPQTPQGIAVDSWAVDFVLLDSAGRIVGNPHHYRDSRTDGMPERLFAKVSEKKWFTETGVQTMQINTLFQLYSMVCSKDPVLEVAESLLMIPDLCTYLLGGEKILEWTLAAATQMYSHLQQDWAREMLKAVNIPQAILRPVTMPGTVVSPVRADVLANCGFTEAFPVIAVGSHDTASAVAAIPEMDADSVFLSSGTWSLMGVETDKPNTSDEAMQLGFTNEGSADGSIRLLKNITGLWLIQECQRNWASEGNSYSWNDLVVAAKSAKPLQCFVDPDAREFQIPCDMPNAIRSYCKATGQMVPQTVGDVIRCILESLSLKYRYVFQSLCRLTGRRLNAIRIVGGGGQNAVLCQMTADACDCAVVCGPVEASALGNVMLQAIATGHLDDVQSGRAALKESEQRITYAPQNIAHWDEAYDRFCKLN